MSKKPDMASSLANILKARRADDQADELTPSPALPAVEEAEGDDHPVPAAVVTPRPVRSRAAAKAPETTTGKRNHPDYCQANAYVPKKLRKAVDKALLDIDDLDYSTLVENLLTKWLKSRGIAE